MERIQCSKVVFSNAVSSKNMTRLLKLSSLWNSPAFQQPPIYKHSLSLNFVFELVEIQKIYIKIVALFFSWSKGRVESLLPWMMNILILTQRSANGMLIASFNKQKSLILLLKLLSPCPQEGAHLKFSFKKAGDWDFLKFHTFHFEGGTWFQGGRKPW